MAGSDLFTGTLDILILKALTWGPRHGYAIGRWIRETTEDVLAVQEGALYPALHRLERRGIIRGVGRDRYGAPGEVLHAHGRRPRAPEGRVGAVDGVLAGGHSGARRDVCLTQLRQLRGQTRIEFS